MSSNANPYQTHRRNRKSRVPQGVKYRICQEYRFPVNTSTPALVLLTASAMHEFTAPFDLPLAASAAPGFDDLIERHKTLVFRTAWRMTGNPADAEDIAQEVFLRLHKRRKDDASAAWLYRVTVNLCLDQIRKRKATVEPSADMASATPTPEQLLSQNQKQCRLARMIARLPERERACLILRDLEGLTSREAAAILDCSEETVRSAIHRAKEKLRQWMTWTCC